MLHLHDVCCVLCAVSVCCAHLDMEVVLGMEVLLCIQDDEAAVCSERLGEVPRFSQMPARTRTRVCTAMRGGMERCT